MALMFPNGYTRGGDGQAGTGDMRTAVDVLKREAVRNLEPEFRRRVLAVMKGAARAGVLLGVGDGWRIQPVGKKGFAAPGNSYHESMPVPPAPASATALAADMVPEASWPWMNANCHHYALIHFAAVNGEPWHIQPIEIPHSRNWRKEPYHLAHFRPSHGHFGPWPILVKASLKSGSYGDDVRYAKGVLHVHIERFARFFADSANGSKKEAYLECAARCRRLNPADSRYGRRTKNAVRATQVAFGLTPDGEIGPAETWPFLDRLADGEW